MKMYFFRSSRVANFGDELNEWMWPRLLPDFFDDDECELFLGIGSVLFDHHPAAAKKLVFGAGYGGYTAPPVIDDTWDFRFVRGRLTTDTFGLPASMAVGDAAILVRSCGLQRAGVRHRVSFMPHWESVMRGHWKDVCDAAGIHYIAPSDDVDSVLAQLLASDLVLTEAMHGAIVADALRVPWIPLRPIQERHRMKWNDWASALELTLPQHSLPASSALEYIVGRIGDRSVWGGRLQRRDMFRDTAKSLFVGRAARYLERLANAAPSLSSDAAIDRSHSRMLDELQKLKSQHRPVDAAMPRAVVQSASPRPAAAPRTSATPTISVVIPLYNKERTIERAVRSVMAQTFQDIELIVVDDGSTDASVDRLLATEVPAPPGFQLVRQANAGPGAARNTGARHARGKYLAFLDADDEWRPEYLARAVAALQREPECQLHVAAYDTGKFQRLQRNLLVQSIDRTGRWSLPPQLGPVQIKNIVDACQISCVVVDAGLFKRLGGFYERDRCTFGEDTYLVLQMVLGCDIVFDLDPLVCFHVEDSELGVRRSGVPPLRPCLIEPGPLFDHCPPPRMPQLQALLAYYRMLETEKFARSGDWRTIASMRRQYRWPTAVPRELMLREWKVPLRTLAGRLAALLPRPSATGASAAPQ
jgi:succinoglycan biosynthesis protein ExoV